MRGDPFGRHYHSSFPVKPEWLVLRPEILEMTSQNPMKNTKLHITHSISGI
jgi:hypothetical protein